MCAALSHDLEQARRQERAQGPPVRTRRGVIAAAGGVGALLAAKTLGSPAPAQAMHRGPVYLGDVNLAAGDITSIVSFASGGRPTFRGENTSQQGGAYGVEGRTSSLQPSSSGVHGVATQTNGNANGVHGLAQGSGGDGVFGEATNPNANANGVHGQARGPGGNGVFGEAPGQYATGVWGLARGERGTGVSGTGGFAGVWGAADTTSGYGVLADSAGPGVALLARGEAQVEANNGDLAFRVDATDPAVGQTAILVRRNVGGTFSLQRVSVGAPNSGGTGFRVLRVPN
jgi:hypothetical protein